MFNAPSDLIDESIHMASAFQLLGCSHVVATLWEIEDATAARVADDFYAGLIDGGVVDPRRAPYALHHAWRAVRDEYREAPSLWGRLRTRRCLKADIEETLALAQLPRRQRRRALIRTDSGGGTHEFLAWLLAAACTTRSV